MKEVAFKWAFKKDMGFGHKEIAGYGNNVTKGKKAESLNYEQCRGNGVQEGSWKTKWTGSSRPNTESWAPEYF